MSTPVRIELENGKEQSTPEYEWKVFSNTSAGATPNVDLSGLTPTNTSALLFSKVKRAHRLNISVTANTYVELSCDGSAQGTYDPILVTSTTPLTDNNCVVDKIYISTGGAASVITVYIR